MDESKRFEGKSFKGDKKEKKISNLTYDNSLVFENTTEDYYTLRKGGNLDKAVINAFENEKIHHVLVTGQLQYKDQIIFVSDSFNRLAFENIMDGSTYEERGMSFEDFILDSEDGQVFYNELLKKIAFNSAYEGFELISLHIRTIYNTE